jgi:hypothetical protein
LDRIAAKLMELVSSDHGAWNGLSAQGNRPRRGLAKVVTPHFSARAKAAKIQRTQ